MRRFRFRASVAVPVLALVLAAASGVVAATQSSDEQALQPTRQSADQAIESRVSDLLSKMTLEEKLEQIQLLPDFLVTEAEVRKGLGSILSVTDPVRIRELQRIAVEESRLKIPMLFAFDTIHGFRTIFPIPLGAGASFDPQVAFDDHRYGARESAVVGLKQTYAPMVDVSHEPRWGRIAEAAGEDPYLNSVLAAARVKAIQGTDYSAPDKLVASPKHFAAYGQPESGRLQHDRPVRAAAAKPLPAAVQGRDRRRRGHGHVLVQRPQRRPGLRQRLPDEPHPQGRGTLTGSSRATGPPSPSCARARRRHPTPASAARGGRRRPCCRGAGAQLRRGFRDDQHAHPRLRRATAGPGPHPRCSGSTTRCAGSRVKFRAGLFENPYAPVAPDKAEAEMLKPDAVAAARKAASRSMVLLQNNGVDPAAGSSKKTAVIGPLAKNQHDMLGPWWGAGRDTDAVSIFDGINQQSPGATYAEGCKLSTPSRRTPIPRAAPTPIRRSGSRRGGRGPGRARPWRDARDERRGGVAQHPRPPGQAGGAAPGDQGDRKPVAVVLLNGRPLALENVVDDAPAILEAWFPGVQAGPAVADVLFGKVNPGGKLPVSFPRRLGQVPIYYNHEPTGRPCNPDQKYNSRHRDIPSCSPLFVFGHGLSYTTFEVSNLRLSLDRVQEPQPPGLGDRGQHRQPQG